MDKDKLEDLEKQIKEIKEKQDLLAYVVMQQLKPTHSICPQPLEIEIARFLALLKEQFGNITIDKEIGND